MFVKFVLCKLVEPVEPTSLSLIVDVPFSIAPSTQLVNPDRFAYRPKLATKMSDEADFATKGSPVITASPVSVPLSDS